METAISGMERLTLSNAQIMESLEQHRGTKPRGATASPAEVGESLKQIRDKRLHREVSDNFYDYCVIRFGLLPHRVDHLIAAINPRPEPMPKPTPVPAKPEPVVYFLRGGDLVKIGYTTGLRSRVSMLSTASPVPLTLIGFVAGGRDTEQGLHARFAQYHRHGEWFELSDEIAAFVKEHANGA